MVSNSCSTNDTRRVTVKRNEYYLKWNINSKKNDLPIKQMGVTTNRTSFLRGNRGGHRNKEIKTCN